MEKRILIRDNQQVLAEDLNNGHIYAQAAIDHVVADAITTERRFAGLKVTQAGASEITIEPGRLYQEGAVFTSEQAQTRALATLLPVATRKIVSIVTWGAEQDAAVEPRDFLVDVENQVAEPQAVATERHRQANIDIVAGIESADPQPPALPQNTLRVANISLFPTGIDAIERVASNQVPSAATNESQVANLESWRARTGPRIDALTTAIASTAVAVEGKADLDAVISVMADMALLKEKLDLPDSYTQYGADRFESEDETDQTLTGDTATVDHGLLFPAAAQTSAALALFNPIDASVNRTAMDLVLPAYDEIEVLRTEGYAGDLSISQYQVQTHAIRKQVIYKWRYTYGWRWNYYRSWYYRNWRRRYGSSYWYRRGYASSYGYWTRYPQTVYQTVATTENYSGAILAQTFVTPRALWLTGVGLYLTQVADGGDIQVVICKTVNGKPVLDQSLAVTTVPHANLRAGRAETRATLPPVWLEAGKRYAITLLTQGDHRLSRISGNSYTEGTLFYGNDGEYFTGDLTKDIEFSLYGAQFKAARTEVALQNVSLSGGITDLDIETDIAAPDGTELTFEIQVAGRWYPLTQTGKLAGSPDIVPLRAVFLGTRDAAPALQLASDAVKASRSAEALIHYSTSRTLQTPSQSIQIILTLSDYDANDHSIAAQLVKSDSTEIDATSSAVTTESEGGGETVTKATFTFTLSAAISSYQMKITGTRTSPASVPFTILERLDVAS